MLFYFTATGNSLFVAKQFEENPISIPQIINNLNLDFEDEKIGVVLPVYGGEPPKIVLNFLKKATFKTDYFYVILTYGKDDSDAPEYLANLCKEFGLHIDYIQSILMVDNYLPSFNMLEEKAIDKKIDEQLKAALKDVKERKKEIPEASQEGRDFHARAAKIFADNPSIINGEQITITEKCVGCGICVRVCPVGNIYIEDGIAKRKKETCEFCLACAHHCPNLAITLSINDKNPNARYINENVKLAEIIKANNQK